MISKHDHVKADILSAQAAVSTVATGKNRGDEDTVTDLEVFYLRANFLNYARRFMAQDHRRLFEGVNTMVYIMKVSIADTTGCDFNQNFMGFYFWSFNLFYF